MNTTAIDGLLWSLWERCLLAARDADYVPADAVERVIQESRALIARHGHSQAESDYLLFDLYTRVHWDWQCPTDRVFETLLEFELEGFFNERFPKGRMDA